MRLPIAFGASLMAVIATSAVASTPVTLYPEHIGAETARFYRGNPTLLLQTSSGAVEIRPLPVEKGRVALAIAVYNQGPRPANFGIENISASINGMPVAIPTHDQLVEQAQRKARNTEIGAAIFTGVLAGVASTASNHGTYYRYSGGPHGGYTQAIHWHDDTPGIIGASAAVAGGALVIHGIDKKLDYTIDQLNSQILETTTVDPGSTFGGTVIVPTGKNQAYPAEIRLQVTFDGVAYPFAFRLTPSGVNVPPLFPATVQNTEMPDHPQQSPTAPTVPVYPLYP